MCLLYISQGLRQFLYPHLQLKTDLLVIDRHPLYIGAIANPLWKNGIFFFALDLTHIHCWSFLFKWPPHTLEMLLNHHVRFSANWRLFPFRDPDGSRWGETLWKRDALSKPSWVRSSTKQVNSQAAGRPLIFFFTQSPRFNALLQVISAPQILNEPRLPNLFLPTLGYPWYQAVNCFCTTEAVKTLHNGF